MTKSLASLPDDISQILQNAKEQNEDKDLFLSLVARLRELGWPLRAIAEPFQVSRTTAKNWETSAKKVTLKPSSELPQLPAVPVISYGQEYRPQKIKPDITQKDLILMKNLAKSAKKVTRWSEPNSSERNASKQLEEKILYYVDQRKVNISVIARHLGVTRRSVSQRIEKYKYKD